MGSILLSLYYSAYMVRHARARLNAGGGGAQEICGSALKKRGAMAHPLIDGAQQRQSQDRR
jgi:hypothetical protein